MAFDKFLEFFQFKDEDDEYYDPEDDMAEEDEKPVSRQSQKAQSQSAPARPVRSSQPAAETPAASRPASRERSLGNSSNKVVSINNKAPRSFEVSVLKPANINDAIEACDMLLTGRATVVNLEGQDPVEAQRIIDFISGCLYAINGRLNKISKYIFIFSPENVDISGDLEDLLKNDGSFSAPTINKEF